MRTALIQMTASDDPQANLTATRTLIDRAVAGGAGFVLTPEVTNIVSSSRKHQMDVLRTETDDPTLAALQNSAAHHGIWLLIGSLALRATPPETRFVNRSFLIAPDGRIVARYDKIHLFDVQINAQETYRESAGYAPGDQAVLAKTPFGTIGMTICYDLRFAHLYRDLAQAGAQILTVPAAFSPVTGTAHWEPLLRARAIECGAWVLAPAQTGHHPVTYRPDTTRPRATYGHSLAISPWGTVITQADTAPGVHFVTLDLDAVDQARDKLPTLHHDRSYRAPLLHE
ncbi:MAG: carbon-nitrogen hydrolase family protein [Paracoccaceae bacterium]